MEDNKAICAAPWSHYYLQPDGKMHPCCTAYDIEYGNTNEMSLKDAWNSETAQKFRSDLRAGIKQDACKFCYMQEKHSGSSLRTSLNARYFSSITDSDTPEMNIKYLDVRSSNTCNMACVMCYHGLSSSWYEDLAVLDPDAHKKIPNKFIKIDQNTEAQVLESISSDLDVVYFAGGEPLITPYHYTVLDYLIENDYAKNIKLEYNTNLSTLKYKKRDLFDLWKHFKRVEIRASVDTYGPYAEYQRYGTVWTDIVNNWKRVMEHPDIIIRPQITITTLTIGRLPEFLDILTDELGCKLDLHRHINGIAFNMATTPAGFNIQNLPEELKDSYIEKLNTYCKKENKLTTPMVETCISFMKDKPADQSKFIQRLEILTVLDVKRNKNWEKLWPEFVPYFYGDKE